MSRTVLFVRAMPLNATPAVERYVKFLRANGFDGRIVGAELDPGTERTAATFVDELLTLRGSFDGVAQRAKSLLKFQLFVMRAVMRVRPDVIHFCDVFSSAAGIAGKCLPSAKLVFDIRDPVELSTSHYGPLVPRVLSSLEAWSARLSDAIIVVSPTLLEFVPKTARKRAVVILNSPEQDAFSGYQFSSNDRITVNLAGFISHRRNLSTWCEVLRRDSRIDLDLYGTIADEQSRGILKEYGLENVKRVSHEEALIRSRSADVVALTYDPSIAVNQYAAPNKFFEALMLGKPIICSKGMRFGDQLAEKQCGLVVPYGNVEALAAAVEMLFSPTVRQRMGRNARRLFERQYFGQARDAMQTLYQRLGLVR